MNLLDAPIRTGVTVESVQKSPNALGFTVQTSAGTVQANSIVSATGAFQLPAIPKIVPQTAPVIQLHSSEYKNQEQIPEGGVIVVGAGSSGVQIADELNRV